MTASFVHEATNHQIPPGRVAHTDDEKLASTLASITQQAAQQPSQSTSFASSESSTASSVFTSHCPLSVETTVTRLSDSESSFRNGMSCAVDAESKELRRKMNEQFQRHHVQSSQAQQAQQHRQQQPFVVDYTKPAAAHARPHCQQFGNFACAKGGYSVSNAFSVAIDPRESCRRVSQSRSHTAMLRRFHGVSMQQRDKNFVGRLVDSATQIVEAIWPIAAYASLGEPSQANREKLSLHTFIQEVLRRSKSSYSTLQVALYYLVLVKSRIPSRSQIAEAQRTNDQHILGRRVMMCGRRMFLTALILASKYLQDHNYSARAWAKISGLDVHELNANEITFLKAVNWKLHIPDSLFQKWNELILRLTSGRTAGVVDQTNITWSAIITHLTPELTTVDHILKPQAILASSAHSTALLNNQDARLQCWSASITPGTEGFVTTQPMPRQGAKVQPPNSISYHGFQRHFSDVTFANRSEASRLDHAKRPPLPCLQLPCDSLACVPTPRTTPPIASAATGTPSSTLSRPHAMSVALDQANQLSFTRTLRERQSLSFHNQPLASSQNEPANCARATPAKRRSTVHVDHVTGLPRQPLMTISPESLSSTPSAANHGSHEAAAVMTATPSSLSSALSAPMHLNPVTASHPAQCATARAQQTSRQSSSRRVITQYSQVAGNHIHRTDSLATEWDKVGACFDLDFLAQEAARGLCSLSSAATGSGVTAPFNMQEPTEASLSQLVPNASHASCPSKKRQCPGSDGFEPANLPLNYKISRRHPSLLL